MIPEYIQQITYRNTESEVCEMLAELVQTHKPKKVLELGTGADTTPWLAWAAMQVGAQMVSVDIANRHNLINDISNAFGATITFAQRDAKSFVSDLDEPIEFVFVDAGMTQDRVDLISLCTPRLAPGGILVAHDIDSKCHDPIRTILLKLGGKIILNSLWGLGMIVKKDHDPS